MKRLTNTTIPAVFQEQVAKYGDRACVAYRDNAKGQYIDISWNEMDRMVRELALYLISIGVKKGDRVGLFSPNRPEWWISDLAILSAGGVNVPIYATNSAEESRYILSNSGSKICIAGSRDHMEKILEAKKKLPGLKKIIVMERVKSSNKAVITWADALKAGAAYKNKGEIGKRLKALKSRDLATIIYTSGTTGDPKGVMLTHDNFISDARQINNDFIEYINDSHVLLSFLPLSHSLERTSGYYFPLFAGCTVAFAEDFSKVVDNMKEVRPTFIISVPRLYEKIHSVILSRLPEASAVKRLMFSMAVNTAKKNLPYVCNDIPPKGLLKLRVRLFDKLVFSKFREGLGMDRMEFAVSGGAPLSVSDAEFFIGMGIKILEGFGLTETTPVTNVNPPWKIKPGTVGPTLSETKVKISDEGELLIKGPQVMKGYYKNPKATAEVFTRDGWFRTGDMARIDEDGYVSITGRIKDIIVTAGGKNISPQNIENDLKSSKYIEQVAVIGDRRKYLSALIIPSFENLQKWAKAKGLPAATNKDLVNSTEVYALMQGEIERIMKNYARVEQIRKFALLDAEWTQDTGEITPSLKVKRRVVEEKYKNAIESMYPSDGKD
ncbi:MAG: long-chain fatty acid--CoA ligase [Spirochaetes bacterium]|nr:long-chain fatty acid--CoA ligase [Spirochaetota bacterium]